VFRNVGTQNSDAGELPKRKTTTNNARISKSRSKEKAVETMLRRYKEMHEEFLSENLLERDHLEDPGEDGRILKRNLKKWSQSVDLIQLAQHRVHRWTVLNVVMKHTLRGIL